MAKRLLAVGGLVLGLTVPAAGASAAETIYAGPFPTSYLNPDVTIDPGESVSFYNIDFTAPHDVTSLDFGSNAQPLFRSETVSAPAEVPVTGAEDLGGGSYEYICSIHPSMDGTLTVSGSGNGDGKDTEAPTLRLKATDRKASAAVKNGRIGFEAKVNEKATLKLVAKKGKKRVAKGSAKLRRGTSTVSARLTRAGKKLLRKAKRPVKLAVKATATDSAGNSRSQTQTVKLR